VTGERPENFWFREALGFPLLALKLERSADLRPEASGAEATAGSYELTIA